MSDEKDFTPFDEVWAELNRDPEFVRADHRLRPYFEVAEDLRTLRREQGLTQQQLAERAQTHQSRISKLETGDLDFKLGTLIAVAAALDSHVELRVCQNYFVTDDEVYEIMAAKPTVARTVASTSGLKSNASAQVTRPITLEIQPA